MLNHKLKNLQRFLQEVSDTAFEFTSLNSEFTAIPTTYDEHFQTVLSARSVKLSEILHEIALEQAKKMIDEPDDWFYNSKTGEVYFNSSYKKGDESLLGEHWEHFGENGVFGKKDVSLLKNFSVSGNFEAITGYLNGKSGKKFMKEQGYNFNPVQEVIYKKRIILLNNPKAPIPVDIEIKFEIIEKSKYMSEDYYRTDSAIPIGKQFLSKDNSFNLSNPIETSSHENISRSRIVYDNNKYLKALTYTLNTVLPSMSPAVFNSWEDYEIDKSNELLTIFLDNFGKQ